MSFELPNAHRDQNREHIADLLPAYVNHTLTAEEHERVRRHLAQCAACRGELVLWQGVAGATRERLAPTRIAAPSPLLLDGVWNRVDARPIPMAALERAARIARRQAVRAAQVLRGQIPLIPQGIWVLSAAAIALAFVLASIWSGAAVAPSLLGLVVPLVAAIGVAFLYGPEQDPGLEVALGTPTSPRLVLLCRLALVFAYDFALATAVTLLLVVFRGAHFSLLAAVWIGPMLLLAGLSLLVSLALGAMAGMGSAVGLVMLRLFASTLDVPGSRIQTSAWHLDALWRTSPAILALAVVLVAASVLLVSRQERLT